MPGIQEISAALKIAFGADQVKAEDRAVRGVDLRVSLQPDEAPSLALLLDKAGFYLEFISAVDRDTHLDLIYVFGLAGAEAQRVMAVAPNPKGRNAPSLTGVFPAADWQERETFDMFGQRFTGHPGLKHLLLPEDADFHPLLKSFAAGPAHSGDHVKLEET